MDEKKLRHDIKSIAANLEMFKELLKGEVFTNIELSKKLQSIIDAAHQVSESLKKY
jgi:hypothetical protein